VYLPAAVAYRVEREMDVQIRLAEAGRAPSAIAGRVRSSARFPASRAQMLRTLASDELVDDLIRTGPPLQVIVELLPGAEKLVDRLFSGTPCQAVITVERHAPIHLVLPASNQSGGS
jgi:hypothetical protein